VAPPKGLAGDGPEPGRQGGRVSEPEGLEGPGAGPLDKLDPFARRALRDHPDPRRGF